MVTGGRAPTSSSTMPRACHAPTVDSPHASAATTAMGGASTSNNDTHAAHSTKALKAPLLARHRAAAVAVTTDGTAVRIS